MTTEKIRSNYRSMGKPIKAPFLIPVRHDSTPNCINEPFMAGGEEFRVTCVSFGTPHGVVFTDNAECADVTRIGPLLETHPLFPDGASIVFTEVADRTKIKARLWQRGGGETPFTEEAVCAAMTAARMLQKVDSEADVVMGGKTFSAMWGGADDEVMFCAH